MRLLCVCALRVKRGFWVTENCVSKSRPGGVAFRTQVEAHEGAERGGSAVRDTGAGALRI